MATVSDIFDSVTEFEDLLSEAEESAGSEWEMDFVDGLRESFAIYKEKMYLSEKQEEILRRVAGDE